MAWFVASLLIIGILISPWTNALNAPAYVGAAAVGSGLLALLISPRLVHRKDPLLVAAKGAIILVVGIACFQLMPHGIGPHPLWAATGEQTDATASVNLGLTVDRVLILVTCLLLFSVAAQIGRSPTLAGWMLTAILLAMTAAAIYGLVRFSMPDAAIFGASDRLDSRLRGPFISPNLFSAYIGVGAAAAAINVLLALGLGGAASSRPRRISDLVERFVGNAAPHLVVLAVLLSALLLTGSRAGVFASLIGLAGGAMLVLSRMGRAWALSVLAITVALGAVSLSGGLSGSQFSVLQDRFAKVDDDLLGGRSDIYEAAGELISERPLVGHGWGTFEDVVYSAGEERPILPSLAPVKYAHNFYLELASGLGVPGTVVLLGAILMVVGRCVMGTMSRRTDEVRYPAIAIAGTLVFAVHGFFDDPLLLPYVAYVYAILLGIGYTQSFSSQS